MIITTNQNGTTLEIALEGRLDTVTAPELEAKLTPVLSSLDTLVYDFAKLEYISSAGLRVMLRAHRGIRMGGKTIIHNCNPIVRKVLSITGFDDVMEID